MTHAHPMAPLFHHNIRAGILICEIRVIRGEPSRLEV